VLRRSVLVEHQLVRHPEQGVEAHVDLRLARGPDLVVLHLDLDAHPLHSEDHLGAQILEVVHRRDREVPLFVPGLVTKVGTFFASRVPDPLDRFDLVEGGVLVLGEADVVEDEELRLRTEVRGVGDARRLHVRLRLLRHITRVTGVRLERQRVVHETVQVQRLVLPEGVHDRSGRIGQKDHVRFVDLLETADGRPVEPEALAEPVLGQPVGRDGEVLHEAGQVTEP
jgi:hypothetical protein